MKTNTLDWADGPQLSNLFYSQRTEWKMSESSVLHPSSSPTSVHGHGGKYPNLIRILKTHKPGWHPPARSSH